MSDQISGAQQTDTAALEEKIKTALREVFDFEIGMNVIELGLIRKLEFHPDLIEVTMILTTPFCPVGPEMMEQVRSKVEKATGLPAHVTLGMEMWDPSMMEGGPPRDWGLY
jgi:metal-sulfur cluster biosynthetic enzyme